MEFFGIFASVHPVLIYLAIFLALAVEGEVFLFAAGLLVYFGQLNYFLVLVVAFAGSWLGDMVWFLAGRKWGTKFLDRDCRWLCWSKARGQRLVNHFQNGQGQRTIFLAKFSYGLSHLTIIMAGASQMNFKKFIKINGWTTAIWVLLIVNLVQFLGHSLQYVKHLTKNISLVVAGVLIILIVAEIVFTKKAKISL